jgi:hypothetical protein
MAYFMTRELKKFCKKVAKYSSGYIPYTLLQYK